MKKSFTWVLAVTVAAIPVGCAAALLAPPLQPPAPHPPKPGRSIFPAPSPGEVGRQV